MHRPAAVTIRVAKLSTGLACGLVVVLLLGVSCAAAVGILLGPGGGRKTDLVPKVGLIVPSTAGRHDIGRAVETDAQGTAPVEGAESSEQTFPASVGDDGSSKMPLSGR